MPDQINFQVQLYSPRWGHEDTYGIKLERTKIIIEGVRKSAVCSYIDGQDPKWSGYNESVGNPLENILENDSIYPPTVFVMALEHAWTEWRDGGLDDQQVQKEIQLLCEWVNVVSKSKPKTDFWIRVF